MGFESESESEATGVCVLLPVKNGAAYIAQAVSSILSQTLRDIELIVIDDGSTDATLDRLAPFLKADPRLKILVNPGAGLVDALNYGAASTAAPLIARMDADDIALPERLERQSDFLKANPDVNVVGAQVRFIDEKDAASGKMSGLPQRAETVHQALLKYCCLRHPTVLMRRAALEKAGFYRPQLAAAEDYDLWLRMAEQGKLANLPEVLLLYRLHAGQVSMQKIWTQRLSRNLALISARERRAGRPDPIASYACFSQGSGRHECCGRECPASICESIRAFRSAGSLLDGAPASLTKDDARLLIGYVSRHSIGDGKSNALRVLIALAREAIRRRNPVLLGKALGLALRVHPGRAIRFMLRRASN